MAYRTEKRHSKTNRTSDIILHTLPNRKELKCCIEGKKQNIYQIETSVKT